ncbi:CPCC family cysteine-rich protein [Chryseobacterium terrae]|uniref:CPCC family cysteine-rich protein n=1 Tax=Chryseobacterium terrae TaxID=3163299 RepID=A0ABW8Y1Y9_9FLAO
MDESNDKIIVQCNCCGYFTISERGQYEICNVCFWEDDGSFELFENSGPNHITLDEGRANFLKFGACEERFIKNVVKNPEAKYRKSNL